MAAAMQVLSRNGRSHRWLYRTGRHREPLWRRRDGCPASVRATDDSEVCASASESLPPWPSRSLSPARRSWCRRASASRSCKPGMKSAEQLLREADTALYAAKDRGRARLEQFNDELHARAEKRMQIESDLRAALARIAALRGIPAAGPPQGRLRRRRRGAGALATSQSLASSRPATSFRSPRTAD